METIKKIKDKFPITAILETVEMHPQTWYYNLNERVTYEEKYADEIEKIKEIIENNPGYGYPRIKRELEKEYGIEVGYEVVMKLLRTKEISLARNARKTELSGYRKVISEANGGLNLLKQMEKISPFEVTCTDFTEVEYAEGTRNAQLILLLGHECKMIYGWGVGESGNADLAMTGFGRAEEAFQKFGIDCEGMVIHQDQDPVYTGNRWLDRLFLEERMRPSFSENGAKGNTVMESNIGHFKGGPERYLAKRRIYQNCEKKYESMCGTGMKRGCIPASITEPRKSLLNRS